MVEVKAIDDERRAIHSKKKPPDRSPKVASRLARRAGDDVGDYLLPTVLVNVSAARILPTTTAPLGTATQPLESGPNERVAARGPQDGELSDSGVTREKRESR
jgi:hypothetical protein